MTKKNTFILLFVLLIGLSLLLYPSVSNYWNSLHQSKLIASYVEAVNKINPEESQRLIDAAQAYNQRISRHPMVAITDEERVEYQQHLNISGDGIMGYIRIPSIDCTLPIYHGTEKSVLQVAVGHLEGSSLPVGGAGSHCVLSGHRGLPNSRLFTNLDQMVIGDTFSLVVLDRELFYEVDQILIVDPEDVNELTFEAGEDFCTLVTCTPYGVNSHRLLVRGHRVENATESTLHISADGTRIDDLLVAAVASIPVILALLIYLIIRACRRR